MNPVGVTTSRGSLAAPRDTRDTSRRVASFILVSTSVSLSKVGENKTRPLTQRGVNECERACATDYRFFFFFTKVCHYK